MPIQIGLMRIQKALIEDTISTKKAGLLLYSMQLALTNVGQTTFGQAKDEEMVRETVDEEEAFSNQQSAISQTEDRFTTEGTEGTEEAVEERRKDVEFVRVPGGYGFHRVRLGIEPSGHQAILPQPAQKRRGPGTPGIEPGAPQTYANLG